MSVRTKTIVSLQTLLCLLVFSQLARAEVPVYFGDTNLKAAVESKLGITDPTPTDMLVLTSLTASKGGISVLRGIEYASNLRGLWLDANYIRDISALSELTNLTFLHLEFNRISDISPYSGLRTLPK